ncbi:MAG: hypothetical protein Q8O76_04940 [Chloroflexota bacterium]|nr:hypothetical protein [Chloroflexota bacterium]
MEIENGCVGSTLTPWQEWLAPEDTSGRMGSKNVAKPRTLTYDGFTHYQKVIVALKETIGLMGGNKWFDAQVAG